MRILVMIGPQVDYGPGGAVEHLSQPTPWQSWLEIAEDYDELWIALEAHPADHISFASMHPWRRPGQTIEIEGQSIDLHITHCVAGSFGARILAEFDTLPITKKLTFGEQSDKEPESVFDDSAIQCLHRAKPERIDFIGASHGSVIFQSITELLNAGLSVGCWSVPSNWPDKQKQLATLGAKIFLLEKE